MARGPYSPEGTDRLRAVQSGGGWSSRGWALHCTTHPPPRYVCVEYEALRHKFFVLDERSALAATRDTLGTP